MVVFFRASIVAAAALVFNSLVSAAPAFHEVSASSKPYAGQQLVRVELPSGVDAEALHEKLANELSLDIWDWQASHVDLRLAAGASASVFNATALAGAKVSVIEKDIQALVDKEAAGLIPASKAFSKLSTADRQAAADTWFTAYHRFADIVAWYQQLAATYPNLVTFVPSIGKTVQGRDIFAVKITSKAGSATKPQFFFQGLIHAREWISGATVQYVTQQLLQGYAADPSILDSTEFIIVPVVNPDGYEYTWTGERLWRKNRASPSGVDLNRNYDDHWGQGGSSSSPSSETYKGPSAASEPETKAVSNYFLSFPRLVGAIDFHSYSQLVLRPLGYSSKPAPDEALNKQAGDGISAQIKAISQKSYVSQLSIDLYVTTGTSTDYWYTKKRIYSFCIELRPGDSSYNGFVLAPSQIIPTGQEIWGSVKWWVSFTKANPLPKA